MSNLKSQILLLLACVLCACQESNSVLFGHQDDVVYGSDWQRLKDKTYFSTRSCIHDVTGQWPDMIGFDIGGIELKALRNLDSVPFSRMIEECQKQFNRGGSVTLSWHARNPLTLGNSWDTTSCIKEALLSASATHDTMAVWINRAATFTARVSELQRHPGQLIVRLYHEQSGDWFWWGRYSASADEYKQLWIWTRTAMAEAGTQALWAYSPDKLTLYPDDEEGAYRETLEWYPGDEYVDIIGTDCYHFGGAEGTEDYLYRAHRQLNAAQRLAAERGKHLAFTETGNESIRCPHWYTEVLLPLCQQYPLLYVHVWRNAWDIPHHYYVPGPNHPEAEDFRQFIQALK